MFKTMSAALVAAALLAAPAMAATVRVAPAPAAATVKSHGPMNARAEVVVVKKVHPRRHVFHRHYHPHKVVVVKKHHH